MVDGDSSDSEAAWIRSQRSIVEAYLARQGVVHGGVDPEPAWAAPPVIAVWAIRSRARAGAVGWWAISGDLPTDYLSAAGVPDARSAVAGLAARWREWSAAIARGERPAGGSIGAPEDWPALSVLLGPRADTLARWAADPENW